MMNRYDPHTDRMTGHDYPGMYGSGFLVWEMDELEVGARAAFALEDPDQWWWVLIGDRCAATTGP